MATGSLKIGKNSMFCFFFVFFLISFHALAFEADYKFTILLGGQANKLLVMRFLDRLCTALFVLVHNCGKAVRCRDLQESLSYPKMNTGTTNNVFFCLFLFF